MLAFVASICALKGTEFLMDFQTFDELLFFEAAQVGSKAKDKSPRVGRVESHEGTSTILGRPAGT